MNNGKYDTVEYKQKQAEKADRLFGPVIEHEKVCQCCGKKFIFKGRIKTKKFEESRFCSRSCANNRQLVWNNKIKEGESNGKWVRYRVVAFKHHGEKCLVCGFDKVLEVHHIDKNRDNNSKENLVPLCPNHHRMIHTPEYTQEIINEIKYRVNGLLV